MSKKSTTAGSTSTTSTANTTKAKKGRKTVNLFVSEVKAPTVAKLDKLAFDYDCERNDLIWAVLERFVEEPSKPNGLESKTAKLRAELQEAEARVKALKAQMK